MAKGRSYKKTTKPAEEFEFHNLQIDVFPVVNQQPLRINKEARTHLGGVNCRLWYRRTTKKMGVNLIEVVTGPKKGWYIPVEPYAVADYLKNQQRKADEIIREVVAAVM